MKNMREMMKQAQKMQKDMAKVQEELEAEEVEASAGGGAVKVVVTGSLSVKQIVIDPDAVEAGESEMLADMVLVAVNDGLTQAQELASRRMQEAAGPMAGMAGGGIPGL